MKKKSYELWSGNASFTSYMYGRANAENLYVCIEKSFLKGNALVTIPLVQSIAETGSFIPNTVNRGRNRNIRTPAIEEQVIRRRTENPRLAQN